MSSRDKCEDHENRGRFPSSSVYTEHGSTCEDNSSIIPEHYKEDEYHAAFNNSASTECTSSENKTAPEERVSAEPEEGAASVPSVCTKINQGAADETATLDGPRSPGEKSPKRGEPALSGISSENRSAGETKQEMPLELLVSRLGMTDYLKRKKLSLTAVLEINEKNISPTEEPIQSLNSVCWWFLRKLCRVNVMARHVRCTNNTELKGNSAQDFDQILNELLEYEASDDNINPLDLITALFLCSDGLLQQEMALKMSLCQFSIPLLLPNCDTQQFSLMLWALRDIVKSYRPHSKEESRGFEENSIVLTDLPMISFVRLGKISMSKSHILNQVFSNPQQSHDTFVHHNMKNGNISRKVSNGMVEISWYLPGGKSDTFTEPLAVANLRGDISSHQTGFRFLCRTSAAVFVFIDDFKENINLLKPQDSKAPLFLVCDSEKISINKNDFKNCIHYLKCNTQFIVMKGIQMNDAEFVDKLRSTIKQAVSSDCAKMSIEKMSAVARELQILVDEDNDLCQKAKQKADAITASISDIPKYKQDQLPLQGDILKKLAKLEKEECRLKDAGTKNIPMYRIELNKNKQELRKQQVSKDITPAVNSFISGLLVCKEERAYFLKWMMINLDNLSKKHVLSLKEVYKKEHEDAKNKELILDLENQMSCSSLGIEHFLRELGQLYESAISRSEHSHSKQKMQMIKDLPKVCAKMMLEGFPFELVDGDAAYIPLMWVSAVLNELRSMEKDSKIRVISVVGVQSTGKSTLLNTMFGVQFAVSSGRCTRGAFMLLVRVSEDFREQLGCDFIMVIDTEGLRAAAVAQLADSYEHDNELSTLLVGLSDFTIINIAMENSTEMQEILQIVIHAFLRMKEFGKKTHCLFVHQNVADVAAHGKSENDRKIRLEQLNTITQAAAKMERKGEVLKFTDIIEYSDRDNFYIPSLWQGTPPMAAVSAGYSESVVQIKKCLIDIMTDLKEKRPVQSVEEFQEWIRRLWQAVKYENFIFSFRNSIVAEAYSKLCEQYNKWDWDFRRKMREWMVKAETKVLNFGTVTQSSQPAENIENFLMKQKNEVIRELGKAEQQLNDNLSKYFENPENRVGLVERYKQDFLNSIKSLRQETENKMMRRFEELLRIKKGRNKLEKIKENQAKMMEEKVSELLEKCRKSKDSFSDDQLDKEFEQMWNDVVNGLPSKSMEEQNVSEDIYFMLHKDLENRGSSAMEILSEVSDLEDCGREAFVVEMNLSSSKIDGNTEGSGMKATIEFMKTPEQLIENCQNFIADKVSRKAQLDYDSTYVREMLIMINDYFQQNAEDLYKDVELQTKLKIHICGIAAREFQQMHKDFIQSNDPLLCLEKDKEQYYRDFKDLYHETDQAQRKAEEFTKKGLEPSVRKYITDYLGSDVLEKMEFGPTGMKFRTRSFFQYSILEQLLKDHEFEKFRQFITNYEKFIKDWIVAEMKDTFSEKDCKVSTLEIRRLEETVSDIKKSIQEARKISEGNMGEQNIHNFIDNLHKHLGDKLIISPDALKKVQILNNATIERFSTWLISSVENMKETLISEFQKDEDISSKLEKLPFKPQEELFSRMFGCGKMCPFCEVPCEVEGDKHDAHSASYHRPTGIRGCKWQTFEMLSTDVCPYLVTSEKRFTSSETEIPFKDNIIHPEWHIESDTSIKATDYWKYVFAQFNDQLAAIYGARPAYLPPDWLQLKKEDARNCLGKELMFNRNTAVVTTSSS
ncbi:interferon-induced very large GTPase 1-like [Brienomyrus brachyistius]|uniref:interferon-induced very large GTPase 1-like n=1 Tax=Brienomyrus brachyistius TaxID=42636 RepID=UPI0020B2C546|nr:interferon-induced very large GTPase 1-like [Brienomyrus brachyistius]